MQATQPTRPTRMWPLWLTTTALVLVAGLAHAEPAAPDWPRFNHQVVQQHLLPRYARLDSSAATLAEATDTLCQAPSAQTLATTQDAWRDAMQAWQGIQHVQFGPVQFLMRNFGLQFWPDRKNIGARQLRQALMSEQPYDDEFFRHASVSIQGLPALERLLFADDALDKLQSGRSCELSRAIASHVADMSQAIHQEWQTQAEADFAADQDSEQAAEWAVELLASLVEPIEAIRDSKILTPLGESAESARALRLESHRSRQSLDNIRTNLAALTALYQETQPSLAQLLQQAGAAELADDISRRFEQINRQLAQVPAPLAETLTQPKTHAQLLQVAAELKQLSEQLNTAMGVLNIQLGFNSRDGD